jgi:hypothetical protein
MEAEHTAVAPHATEESHAAEANHAAEESPDDSTTGTPDAHAGATTDDGAGNDETESHESAELLGVELDSLNLAYPRLIVLVLAATLLAVIAALFIQSTWVLAVIAALSVVGVAVSVREAIHAGEELGLFVPLPALAAVLYAGAGVLAVLQIVTRRVEANAAHATHE